MLALPSTSRISRLISESQCNCRSSRFGRESRPTNRSKVTKKGRCQLGSHNLRRELDEAMLLCGCTKLSDIDESLLRPWPAQCHLIDTSLRGLTLRLVAGSSAKSMPSSIRPAVTRRKFLSATLWGWRYRSDRRTTKTCDRGDDFHYENGVSSGR